MFKRSFQPAPPPGLNFSVSTPLKGQTKVVKHLELWAKCSTISSAFRFPQIIPSANRRLKRTRRLDNLNLRPRILFSGSTFCQVNRTSFIPSNFARQPLKRVVSKLGSEHEYRTFAPRLKRR